MRYAPTTKVDPARRETVHDPVQSNGREIIIQWPDKSSLIDVRPGVGHTEKGADHQLG